MFRLIEKEKKKMKICVTATGSDLNAPVDPRFGRCQNFVIVDSDTMAFDAMANEAIAAPGGAGIQAAQAMVNKGVDVVISGNIGPNAFQVLSTASVKVATGAYGTVQEAIMMYKSGKLAETGTSTAPAHAGMQQPSQAAPTVTPQSREEELEELSNLTSRLENELEEVKNKISELKRRG